MVGGVLINKFVRKAEGREIVPNVTFWSGLPGHIKVGTVTILGTQLVHVRSAAPILRFLIWISLSTIR